MSETRFTPDAKRLAVFTANTDASDVDGCWLWKGAKTKTGYGLFAHAQSQLAHRFAWAAANGVYPDGSLVCHHCDNPSCVRPDHLFLGNHSDNALDASIKGRLYMQRHPEARHNLARQGHKHNGEANGMCKLTADQVKAIRTRWASGERWSPLGEEFGVTRHYVARICRRQVWRHVP